MVKASLLLMLLLTILVGMLLRWREGRMAVPAATRARAARRPGLLARGKVGIDRWVTAAAIASGLTIALMGGLHWIRLWIG